MGNVIIGSKIKLRDKNLADARDDYRWQTDSEVARLDAATPLTISFPQYLLAYTNELRNGSSTRRLFAIDTLDGKHIGNCVYYGIDEAKGEAELGIMIGDHAYWGKGYGTDAVTTLLGHIFRETKWERIYLKTLESNTRAQRCFRKCGFTAYEHIARDGFDFVLMEIHRKQWQEQHQSSEAKKELSVNEPA